MSLFTFVCLLNICGRKDRFKMTRAERRIKKRLAIERRKEILKATGYKQGLLYKKHVEKIKMNDGYIAKHGTLLHYAQGSTITEKTRDKSGYAGTNNWSYRDKKQILSGTEQMREYKDNN